MAATLKFLILALFLLLLALLRATRLSRLTSRAPALEIEGKSIIPTATATATITTTATTVGVLIKPRKQPRIHLSFGLAVEFLTCFASKLAFVCHLSRPDPVYSDLEDLFWQDS